MGKSSASASPSADKSSGARRRVPRRAWVAVGCWFAATVSLLVSVPRPLPEEAGEIVLEEVLAPRALRVVDMEATAAERERIERRYPRIWRYDPNVKSEAILKLRTLFEILESTAPTAGADLDALAEKVNAQAQIRLRSRDLDLLYKTSNLKKLRADLTAVVERTMDSRIVVSNKTLFNAHMSDFPDLIRYESAPPATIAPGEIDRRLRSSEPLGWPDDARRYLTEIELRAFYPSGQDRPLVEVASQILDQTLGPNLSYNQVATRANLTESLQRIDANPLEAAYNRGELIAAAGAVLTATQALALREVNDIRRGALPFNLLGIALLTLLCFGAAAFYLGRLREEFSPTPANLAMTFIPPAMAIAGGRLVQYLELGDAAVQAALFPAAIVGMLATIVMGAQVGFVLVLVAGLLFGVCTSQNLDFFIVAIFGGFTAVISLQSIRTRLDVMIAGVRVGAVNAVAVCILGLLRAPPELNLPALGSAFANGLVCGAATLPLVAVFERAFGIVTDIRLLEITGPQHPLIRMMEEKAPGTYQHVLNVTKLAESAAEAVGANFLLTRSGAYFHDIGKMLKPKYFTENQVTLEDKKAHSRLTPYMSVLIIKNHVKEGIELAKKYKLPPKVIDFIPQHHGTSLISYFYREALQRYEESESTSVVREEEFRYPGPKPQSAEAGIVLIADSVEAIVTSTFTQSKVSEHDLRRTVAQAVSDRFNDGQFDECDLTLHDLYKIRESFVKTLKARFHQRIQYQQPQRREAPRVAPRESREPRDPMEATHYGQAVG